jgi:hypothetical protein
MHDDDPYAVPRAPTGDPIAVPPAGIRWARIGVAVVACAVLAVALTVAVNVVAWEWMLGASRPQESVPAAMRAVRTITDLLTALAFVGVYVVFLGGVSSRRLGQLALIVAGSWIGDRLLGLLLPGGGAALFALPSWSALGRSGLILVVAFGVDWIARRGRVEHAGARRRWLLACLAAGVATAATILVLVHSP